MLDYATAARFGGVTAYTHMVVTGTDVEAAARALVRGGLVGIPTETVYGLAANGLDANAVARIFAAKGRPATNPLILHAADARQALAHTRPSKIALRTAQQLAQAFWPGPLTLVLPAAPNIPSIVRAGLPSVAVRVPANALTLALLRAVPFPLAAPSANRSNYVSPTTAAHVAELGDAVAYILDGGPAKIGIESTIVRITDDGTPEILRPGGLSAGRIGEVLGYAVEIAPSQAEFPQAPGAMRVHYSPKLPLYLGRPEDILAANTALRAEELFGIVFSRYSPALLRTQQHWLGSGDGTQAAQELYTVLRQLDVVGSVYKAASVELLPESTTMAAAVNDRIRRAARRYEAL